MIDNKENDSEYSYSYESKDDPNHFDESGMPIQTKWRTLFHINNLWFTPDKPGIYIHLTKYTLFPYVIVVAVMLINLTIFLKYIFPKLANPSTNFKYAVIFFCIYAIFNMEIARFKDPGFLPWNWSVLKKKKYTFNELRDGIAIYKEQAKYAKTHEYPPRAWFSSAFGYFILRGDHSCFWVGQWIGLKNHKWFLNSLISGTIYMILWWIAMIKVVYNKNMSMKWYFLILFLGVEGYFTFVGISQCVIQLINASINTTVVERLTKRKKRFRHGYIDGFIEIYGPLKYCFSWFLPIRIGEQCDGFEFYPNPDWKSPFAISNMENQEKPLL